MHSQVIPYQFIICGIEAFELNSGGLAETTPADAIVGPLFACIIKKLCIISPFILPASEPVGERSGECIYSSIEK